jgi:hypothetical protein
MKNNFLLIFIFSCHSILAASTIDSIIKKKTKWSYTINGGVGLSGLTKPSYESNINNPIVLYYPLIEQSLSCTLFKNLQFGIGLNYSKPNFQSSYFFDFGRTYKMILRLECIAIPVYLKVVSHKFKFLQPFISFGYKPCFVINSNYRSYLNGQKEIDYYIPFIKYWSFLFTSLGVQKSINEMFDVKIEIRYSHTYNSFVYKYVSPITAKEVTEKYSFKVFLGLIGVNYNF